MFYTQAAVDGLGVHEIAEQMQMPTETYEKFGDVNVYVQTPARGMGGRTVPFTDVRACSLDPSRALWAPT